MLKKLMVIAFIFITLFSVSIINSTPVFSGYASTFEVYIGSDSSNAQIVSASKSELIFMNNVCGQAFVMDKDSFDLSGFLKDFGAQIVSVEQIGEGVSYYAFSPKIKYKKQLFNETVNLQIFIGDTVKVGSPIIYGSF